MAKRCTQKMGTLTKALCRFFGHGTSRVCDSMRILLIPSAKAAAEPPIPILNRDTRLGNALIPVDVGIPLILPSLTN